MQYFKMSEFDCKCGKCIGGSEYMSLELLEMLDYARGLAGFPFVVTSGYRCAAHNKAVGGVIGSAHTKGLAVDIKCLNSNTRFKMLKAFFAAGFNRIELAPTWIHVDVDPSKPQDVAFYQSGGRY